MEQRFIDCPDGLFAVDWDLVESIVRSNLYANALLAHSKVEIEENWLGPDIHNYETDWDAVLKEKKRAADFVDDLRDRALAFGMEPQIGVLARMIRETRAKKAEWGENMRAAQAETMKNIDTSVSRWEMATEGAKIVRDLSGEVVVLCASVLTGGAAGLLVKAGSGAVIKAATTWQDTGKGEAAAFAFTTGFVVNVIPAGGAAAKTSEKVALFVVKTKLDALSAGGQALIEGKTGRQAVSASLQSVMTGALGAAGGAAVKTDAVQRLLRKTAYPTTLKIDYKTSDYMTRLGRARDVTEGVVGAAYGETAKRGVSAAAETIVADPPPRSRPPRPVVDQTIVIDEMLLNRAVQGPDKSEQRSLFDY